jgi:dynein light chain roadblock-type
MIRDLDPTNDITFLRIKTKNEEILVTPDKDYMLIAIQGPRTQKDKRDEEN